MSIFWKRYNINVEGSSTTHCVIAAICLGIAGPSWSATFFDRNQLLQMFSSLTFELLTYLREYSYQSSKEFNDMYFLKIDHSHS